MDEALDLADYLPASFKTPNEQEYISFLWATFEENYHNARYQFAFLAYHLLMMNFVYFKVWQIRQTVPDDFEKGLIGFARDDDRSWLRDTSPFAFSRVSERGVLRLLRLIGCDDSQIGNYRKLVDDRNDVAHANGNIYFRTQNAMDSKTRQVLQSVEEIQSHSQAIVSHCYQQFLLQSHNPDEREYPNSEDQVREVLIQSNYLSRKDLDLCVNFDTSIVLHEDGQAVEDLHNTLCEIYATVLEE